VKLLDESAKSEINLCHLFRIGSIHELVAVVIHLHSTVRANHSAGSLSHGGYPPPPRSIKGYLLTTLAQGLGHPDQFLQKFVYTPDVRLRNSRGPNLGSSGVEAHSELEAEFGGTICGWNHPETQLRGQFEQQTQAMAAD